MIIDINYLCEEIHKAIRKHQILTEGRQTKNRNAAKNYIMRQLGYSESDAMKFIGQLKVKIPSVRLQQEKFLLGVARLFIDGDLSVDDYFKCTNFNQTLKLIASDAHVNEYDNKRNVILLQFSKKHPARLLPCRTRRLPEGAPGPGGLLFQLADVLPGEGQDLVLPLHPGGDLEGIPLGQLRGL